ncbi:unnamed protein product [Tuber melanosporum]|uniref:(Perigord truffle) hypothetical protein n=1 Tax=Tuber melanosporum (strain Mel28) TaxID=656061 RepID=D5GF73_TUBMM|nr:uncharacterized protein GSTUM_00006760001 [Tuber melanosporum]CAZ83166.1 unnamed protein product [Tuber melanosporum]
MCLISSRDDDYPPARRVHVYREGRVTREYAATPRRSYFSTSSIGGGRSSTARVRHVYSSPRGSWVSTREVPGAVVLSGRRGYY